MNSATELKNKTAIENVITAFIESWNLKNIEKFGALFAENADFVGVTGLWTIGRETIIKRHLEGFGNMQSKSRLEIIKTEIKFLSEVIGIAHSNWKMSGQQSIDGMELSDKKGVWTVVLQKQVSENWLIIALHNSNIVPPEQAHPELIR
ncbi:MAG: SgcJ/EcaC family oxidoreductase [Pyrinomonadaceae bacterium]|nr:SgcJ/EcaC family oxidoreductase [Pyrinomonadaceae bacterium]